MRMNGIQKEFQVSPIVVSEFSDSFNIGNRFLIKLSKKTPCQISFQDGNTKLQIGNQETELIRVLKTEELNDHIYMEKDSGNVVSKDLEQEELRGRVKKKDTGNVLTDAKKIRSSRLKEKAKSSDKDGLRPN